MVMMIKVWGVGVRDGVKVAVTVGVEVRVNEVVAVIVKVGISMGVCVKVDVGVSVGNRAPLGDTVYFRAQAPDKNMAARINTERNIKLLTRIKNTS
jgi:hypothetical protein